ncbi:MAG: HAMP domain-containing histidine kinase [Phycisphaerales bacterium]|nr:HAMP domain-containing histidine kinase [Phycisphaerales bacterium]
MSTNQDNQNNNPHGDDSRSSPVPEKRTIRPPGVRDVRDPSSSPDTADQLTVLAHDLSNMLDGSMRWLSLAAAAMPEQEAELAPNDLTKAREQIGTVLSTLERMSSMVNAAMRSRSVPIGSPVLGVSEAVNIAMAIDHAVDVVRPMANAVGASIKVRIDPRAGRLPAGPLYTVVLNGLFNAVQSIGSATSTDSLDPGGTVEVVARIDSKREETVIEVIDDGIGLDSKVRNNKAFKHGVTTKPEHSGIGLAMAHQIVEQLEGVITLIERDDRTRSTRPGAILRVCVPIPAEDAMDMEIG